ncbi:MAG: deoxyguanosinetriphosphate triphosphohydrolase [Clostridiales bacterium]|nr:deoxyguanosinetriphosphate triphosphohydrolase [Clostridiales bacterium]MDY5515530.1 deoxyguanosinetriphosphate triphosphohydrolase [Candidatus Ventricola sp.]
MTIKERLEQQERENLGPYAALSSVTRGREHPISADDMRTEYQRDRDRILHCKSFRRLKGKTQVFISPQGDHYRTRLTHTLEVTQVARTLARALRLNEDLAEAIALGHDLGHTPFGHTGEDALDKLIEGGFVHRVQSRRVVEVLERGGEGLNLTWEVRDGIEHHSGKVRPATLEGCCVHLADRIAYINHDIDDAVRGGVLREEELPERSLRRLGRTHGERVGTMISSVVRYSADKDDVQMEPEIWDELMVLRDFMFERVYSRDWAANESQKAEHIVRELFMYYMEHPSMMPNEYMEIAYREGMQRGVCDYVACMTDAYAVKTFQKLFIPPFFDGIG